ncbi:IPExxxVDY family protein [Flavobacterium sp. NST-5]|uniref:IPExxxVDY family protein n=1 Tax=Flavobacterium ichthyis TaxID=2698827 RepID=A0ABW9Z7P8_9FLAO|nr:IPExxxVDY family protein [Flavobacterium ichthyis]NBL64704.1 IPExxxVDY family protein [Flavobacterium ichthyis]
MGTLKLNLGEFDQVDYTLIAIHTTLEDFRLAYFINSQLPILLKKCGNDIKLKNKEGEAAFSHFSYDDVQKDMFWSLVENTKNVAVSALASNTLFADDETADNVKIHLLPELKKVDYFLKIENTDDYFNPEEIVKKLKQIDWISAAYEVDAEKIKSKNNLIF